VIRINQSLQPVPGLSFLSPTIAQTVFTLGYPKIPFARESTLTIQRGEVTNEAVTTLDGHQIFLYSAIARPGNSGGPVIASDGHFVDISMQDLSQQGKESAFSPHYAGIPAHEIARCLDLPFTHKSRHSVLPDGYMQGALSPQGLFPCKRAQRRTWPPGNTPEGSPCTRAIPALRDLWVKGRSRRS